MPNTASNPTAAGRPLVRLGGPEDMVAAIPYLLGFHPRESVVAVGLRGRRRRVCLAIRLDLPPPPGERDAADLIAAHLRNARASQAVLVVITEDTPAGAPAPGPGPRLPREALISTLRGALTGARIDIHDALCIRSGRWWSYTCADPACCPPEGLPVPAGSVTALAAATAADGVVVLPDREALEQTVAPAEPRPSPRRRRLFDAAAAAHRDEVAAVGAGAAKAAVVEELAALIERRAERSEPLPLEQAARIAAALTDLDTRDACIRWLTAPLADIAEGLWRELVRTAPPTYVAAPATLLALHAYARGDGAFARICANRALADDPTCAMARLVHVSLDRGLGPSQIRELAGRLKGRCADT